LPAPSADGMRIRSSNGDRPRTTENAKIPNEPIYGNRSVKPRGARIVWGKLPHISVTVGLGRSAHLSRGLAADCAFPHTFPEPEAEGEATHYGGRHRRTIEPWPTRREALNHLFGIPHKAGRHEEDVRRTPPFNVSMASDGSATRVRFGVVLRVVTSTASRLDRSLRQSYVTMPDPRRAIHTPMPSSLPGVTSPAVTSSPPGTGGHSSSVPQSCTIPAALPP
jgi:hypothetical protein